MKVTITGFDENRLIWWATTLFSNLVHVFNEDKITKELKSHFHLKEIGYYECMGHSYEGQLVALRTKGEMHASLQTTLAYIVEIPIKSATSVLQYGGSHA